MSRYRRFPALMMVLLALVFVPGLPHFFLNAQAGSVTCKSRKYVTTVISKNVLKKGKKAKVTVKVKNTSGKDMKNLVVKIALPAQLKKTAGSLKKTKATLKNGRTYSFSIYVKAKKPLSFRKNVITQTKTTKVTAKNLIVTGGKKKYMTVTATCTWPAEPVIVPDIQPDAPLVDDPADYAAAMISLLQKLNTYAKNRKPGFSMIGNGGYNLYLPKAATKKSLFAALDGVLIEDAISDDDSDTMIKALKEAVVNGKKAFNIEYDDGKHKYDAKSTSIGSVCYSSPEDDLSTIPSLTGATTDNITSLAQVGNFLALLDAENYSSRTKYLDAIRNTNYDLVFVDLFYNEKPLTKEDVDSLKVKKNGGTRMVCAYFSVGEAEKYRYYWQSAWKVGSPAWLCEENPHWKNNFKVKYWYSEWQNILYGNKKGTDYKQKSYLDNIIDAGFDGVYVDVIDAYEYFEKLNRK